MSAEVFAIRLYVKLSLAAGQPVPVNRPVPVGVEVRNVSPNPVWAVGVLDGSEVGLRYPYYIPHIEAPGYELVVPEWPEMTSPLRAADFRLLTPGQAFDPTEPAHGAGYLPLVAFRDFIPSSAGRYRLSLMFSADSMRDEQWLGSLPDPGQDRLVHRVAKVPHCRVVSNVLIVDAC
jgi:hypothetical protein